MTDDEWATESAKQEDGAMVYAGRLTTSLRREAEALLAKIRADYRGVEADINMIEAFAKAQRLEEVEAVMAARTVLETYDFINWLTQRKKELEP